MVTTMVLPKISIICSCYKSDQYLESFLKNIRKQTSYDEIELVIHLCSPSVIERKILSDYAPIFREHLNCEISDQLIPIYTAWNNCVKRARGKYLCIWNVDDRRPNNSLLLLSESLDQEPGVGFTYGDHITVNSLGKTEGKYSKSEKFDRDFFITGMFLGPFFMWRKDLVAQVGYFDEQFKTGGDYDYAVRLSWVSKGCNVPEVIGYYLNINQGASTGALHLTLNIQPIERTVVELRYGTYQKTIALKGFPYLAEARKYNIDQFLFEGAWKSVENFIPSYRAHLKSQEKIKWQFDCWYSLWKIYHRPLEIFWLLFSYMKKTLKPFFHWLSSKYV